MLLDENVCEMKKVNRKWLTAYGMSMSRSGRERTGPSWMTFEGRDLGPHLFSC